MIFAIVRVFSSYEHFLSQVIPNLSMSSHKLPDLKTLKWGNQRKFHSTHSAKKRMLGLGGLELSLRLSTSFLLHPGPSHSLFPGPTCLYMSMLDQHALDGGKPGNANFVYIHLRYYSKEMTNWLMHRKSRHFKCSVIIMTKSTDTNMYVFLIKLRESTRHIMTVKNI